MDTQNDLANRRLGYAVLFIVDALLWWILIAGLIKFWRWL